MSVFEILIGRRLANREQDDRKLGVFDAVPAMGLDALSSSAYGPEAALTILAPLGAASLAFIGWVMAPILVLAAVLLASYWQTIRAYPNNGGAYIVAKENLGTNASLLAAAALMIDYVLNVAVGISAGVAALISALPSLHSYTLPLCLVVLAIVTLANLRGTPDAGRLFAVPTYLFVASFLLIMGIGIYRIILSGGQPQPVIAPPPLAPPTEAVSWWLLMRAFASGCTAMTGVEAVSNGMSAFREPRLAMGRRTLLAIMGILGLLLAGIAWLATAYGIGAMDQTKEGYRSVLSQLAGAVVGDGLAYDVAIGSLLCILALSANTSFVGFPRMCRMVAQDGFLPKSFAIAGRRLVFSVGIIFLAISCALLLVVFGGITDRLIPLFAVGAFLTFTLSQAGMVVHWRRALRDREPGARGHRTHLLINGFGAIVTGVALIVIILAKFIEGAWITILVIPGVILLLKRIHAYYEALSASMKNTAALAVPPDPPPLILVAVQGWNALARKALDLALSLSPDVIAVHLSHLSGAEAEDRAKELRRLWRLNAEEPARAAGLAPPRLIVLQAQYRVIHEPVLKLVAELGAKQKGRRIAILVPEVVKQHWYQNLLHARRASHLRNALMRHGGSGLTIMSMPWYLDAEPELPARARRHGLHSEVRHEEPRPERKVASNVQG